MGYIIGGANLANKETPAISYQVETASDAWEKVAELQAGGYVVRASTSDGNEVALDDIKIRALSIQGP
ncbi:hypothetical protein [Methylobacterium sp. R2-1]|uniref:hypothetical protein n=1 Tax=Methylobacterium sp. R2-1 TaxID=2587064 RepID=UPI0016073388|nr:hypothetical protein [Methylobacterium sp. R2-1]MBB2964611.1 hypothetical protein [Methylobacterium sp. R2-1]